MAPISADVIAFSISTALVTLQSISAVAIAQYEPSHPPRKQLELHPKLSSLCGHTPLPSFIQDPSPAIFATASIVYAFAALVFYQIHRNDKYQDWFMTLGILSGALLPLATWNIRSTKTFLPLSVTGMLAISALGHVMQRRCRGQRVRDGHMQPDGKQDRRGFSDMDNYENPEVIEKLGIRAT